MGLVTAAGDGGGGGGDGAVLGLRGLDGFRRGRGEGWELEGRRFASFAIVLAERFAEVKRVGAGAETWGERLGELVQPWQAS